MTVFENNNEKYILHESEIYWINTKQKVLLVHAWTVTPETEHYLNGYTFIEESNEEPLEYLRRVYPEDLI